MPDQEQVKEAIPFKMGDWVRIKNYGDNVGRIVEFRGPLGPGGALIFRVGVRRDPKVVHIELRGDQLELLAAEEIARLRERRKPTAKSREDS